MVVRGRPLQRWPFTKSHCVSLPAGGAFLTISFRTLLFWQTRCSDTRACCGDLLTTAHITLADGDPRTPCGLPVFWDPYISRGGPFLAWISLLWSGRSVFWDEHLHFLGGHPIFSAGALPFAAPQATSTWRAAWCPGRSSSCGRRAGASGLTASVRGQSRSAA